MNAKHLIRNILNDVKVDLAQDFDRSSLISSPFFPDFQCSTRTGLPFIIHPAISAKIPQLLRSWPTSPRELAANR